MKILELRFQNLNSLYGEWCIDFTAPEYEDNGIFALVGPTGAGKSTILDAICLALYGATPRLGRITKSGNEILSRQAGECYAEVTFSSQAGRFRCHWSHSKARKSVTGKLQEPKHEIADADTGKVLESKKSLVLGIIEAKTGMDFDRFTRSMLLAQGGFDSFLKANSEEKSKILEQITGTGIYSDISVAVHERTREEKQRLQQLQQQLSGIALLSDEELNTAQHKVIELEQQMTQTQQQLGQWQQSLSAYQQQIQLQGELNSYQAELNQHHEQQDFFQRLQQRIEAGQRAATLHSLYQNITALRQRQTGLTQEQWRLANLKPSLQEAATTANDQLQHKEAALVALRRRFAESEPLWQQVRELDYQLQTQQASLAAKYTRVETLRATVAQSQEQLSEQQQHRDKLHQAQQHARDYLREHQADQRLVQELAAIEGRYQHWSEDNQRIQAQEQWLARARHDVSLANQQLEQAQQQYHLAQQQLQSELSKLNEWQQQLDQLLAGKLVREYRAEKDRYEQEAYYLRRIESLEQQRQKLKDGDPCPLCGALEHPYAHGQIPAVDAVMAQLQIVTELLAKADLLEQQITAQKAKVEQAQQSVYAGEKHVLQNQSLVAERQALLAQGEETQHQLQRQQQQATQRLLAELSAWGISQLQQDAATALEPLKERQRLWLAAEDNLRYSEQQQHQLHAQIERLCATLEANRQALGELEQELQLDQQRLGTLQQQRFTLFQERCPEQERNSQQQEMQNAEQALVQARAAKERAHGDLARLETQLEAVEQQQQQVVSELEDAAVRWQQGLADRQFKDESAYLAASIEANELAALQQQHHGYELRQQELATMMADRRSRLQALIEQLQDEVSQDQLESQVAEANQQMEQLREQIAQLKVSLQQHEANLVKVQSQQAALEAQQRECQRWDHLHSLIGSADGKKYRNFAQGLTFELMVAHANRQLERMSDRYLLVRDEQAPLELNIIDNYQAGDIRSTKNLSGGESFIISLALALGLSKMSSRKVRVDSLFLDEGFGTLDEDALEVALDTLASLHEEEKLIGIISHVSALKERISTQIRISPNQGGRSVVQGPGCSRE
ncbi:chromosome segregation protein SMC [Maribrevibacterium harenarium]|uniref:Chromosome segregation protein SMC n=1 Tax=Maribrevibacterium harenarium TaxID=2589817 RepID=A0A501WJN9_9GAMM|nr:AAA family ATPase [Maribrevibacterium harenarium]TPE47347.1 chromosome segregation protein SMC [Maribrevibacterium harenarium]